MISAPVQLSIIKLWIFEVSKLFFYDVTIYIYIYFGDYKTETLELFIVSSYTGSKNLSFIYTI